MNILPEIHVMYLCELELFAIFVFFFCIVSDVITAYSDMHKYTFI